MGSESIGVAVFGVGRWGVHLVRNFLKHPQVKLLAIADPSQERLQHLAQQFALAQDVALLTDWQAALQIDGVKAVVIATPAQTHYTLINAALQHQHHVLAEKPLTLSHDECIALCQLAERQQRQLVVDHTYLFHPAVRQGKSAIGQRLTGTLRYGYATRTHLGPVRQDVDALWDLAIHDIAIFNDWVGETPIQVQAQGKVWLQPQPRDANLFPNGLSDLVWVKLVYPGGFEAFIHLCWFNPDKQRRLCVVGSQGALIFDELSATPLVFQQGYVEQQGQYYIPVNQQQQALAIEPVEPLQQVCDHFIHCIHHNSPSPISSGWVGAQLVQTLCALTRSLNQNGHVVDIS